MKVIHVVNEQDEITYNVIVFVLSYYRSKGLSISTRWGLNLLNFTLVVDY